MGFSGEEFVDKCLPFLLNCQSIYIYTPINFSYGICHMQNNLNQLRAFFLAAREKNLTKAAETLCITQPAVSMQI